MITDSGIYFAYRHIRLDTNQPFYIGIGKKRKDYSFFNEYERAYSKARNRFWHTITKDVSYRVEILLESDSREFLRVKEKELIMLYGRQNMGTGILVNLTDGGDGSFGAKWGEESIQKIKTRNAEKGHVCIGRKCSQETRDKISKTRKENGKSVGLNNSNYGVKSTKDRYNKVRATWVKNGRLKPFIAIDEKGVEYGPYLSSVECADALNIWKCQVKRCLKGIYKTAEGYTFKYVQ